MGKVELRFDTIRQKRMLFQSLFVYTCMYLKVIIFLCYWRKRWEKYKWSNSQLPLPVLSHWQKIQFRDNKELCEWECASLCHTDKQILCWLEFFTIDSTNSSSSFHEGGTRPRLQKRWHCRQMKSGLRGGKNHGADIIVEVVNCLPSTWLAIDKVGVGIVGNLN